MSIQLVCPRCGGSEFLEIDCGPDGYDDDITWTSDVCDQCGLWFSGWDGRWLIDCTSWHDEVDAEEFHTGV
jgi:hypothetical protein